jgi:Dyp-type peroxidase family
MKERVEKVEWHDVQGLVLSAYPRLPYAAYIPWTFVSSVRESKAWLGGLIERLMRADKAEAGSTPSHPRRPTTLKSIEPLLGPGDQGEVWVVNVALTATGLAKLGVGEKELAGFSPEFLEGMAPRLKQELPKEQEEPMPRRCSILGDLGQNSPQRWEWGGWGDNGEIHGMLLLYAESAHSLERLIDDEKNLLRGVELLARPDANPKEALILKGQIHSDRKEHFGFLDGISQPIVDGTSLASRTSPKERRILVVKPGEFLLGYLNERGVRSGAVDSHAAVKEGRRALGRNGSYLVFRQLEQDVPAFRRAMADTAKRLHGRSPEWVAARLVGREQNGAPLIPSTVDVPSKGPKNDFLYYFEDRFGLACPLGAHIRRANPRDIIGPDPDTALRLSKIHRIIRRGRPYGARPADAAPDRAADDQSRQRVEASAPSLSSASEGLDDQKRGILFICLNASIAGQFELIQHSWINNGRFNGLHGESDPISHYPGEDRVLTIQRRPTCEPVDSIHQFVCVRGGAYFFLPGIRALQTLVQ